MNVESSLRKSHVNFRVNEEIKNLFENNCRTNGSTMTYELTQFMKSYIIKQTNFLNNLTNIQTSKPTTDNLHIKPSQKSMEEDWYSDTPSTSSITAERHGNMVRREDGVWEPIK